MSDQDQFNPYVPDEANVAEFTPKAVLFGAFFGILFGASTVYLALRAGLTVQKERPPSGGHPRAGVAGSSYLAARKRLDTSLHLMASTMASRYFARAMP